MAQPDRLHALGGLTSAVPPTEASQPVQLLPGGDQLIGTLQPHQHRRHRIIAKPVLVRNFRTPIADSDQSFPIGREFPRSFEHKWQEWL